MTNTTKNSTAKNSTAKNDTVTAQDLPADAPLGRSAVYKVLTTGYVGSTGPGVAATVSYVSDAGRHFIFDPGMVASHADILGPLAELGLGPEDITDVVLSHHHPDNTMNVGLFGRARVHDHKVEYQGDQWTNRDAEGYELTPSLRLIRTPGHSHEDITLLAGTESGVVAFAGDLWWHEQGPADDPVAPDREVLGASRLRVLAAADLIVPGHGGPFAAGAAVPL
ncbi:MBL fold metallo-hydrolase [Streptomyces sp. NBC_00335]|uniref:MBL fold metallo-hydrolase n=1 Tax=unclassified Streptomyces TaxID=2593676 RepID=UPI002253062B|nr:MULTISPECIES: MBL fold metallo-hydrolase [unclassified Streptomyces]MCX5409508.1 MBL fold metallo-hydrolase [Streptomyces sp. NBC_00086]